MFNRVLVLGVVLTAVAALTGACGGDDGPAGDTRSPSGAEGYELRFEGRNFVLPQWGGIDGATLTINEAGTTAFGELDRTGDGRYEVVYVDRETFFRRTTCDHFARIPGGGPDVLKPFLTLPANALEAWGDVNPAPSALRGVDLDAFGTVDIEVDAYGRPMRIASAGEGGEVVTISLAWGVSAVVSKPDGVTGDQGPGGNPC